MCGITGFWSAKPVKNAGRVIKAMTDAISHRGPDSDGSWIDTDAGIALGHRRLAIIDLSPAGHQPMVSNSRRFILSYNGEIYNHHDIRNQIDPSHNMIWRGHSDTETLLAAIEKWGLEKALVRLNGMFAFALWDKRDRKLYIARDRMGEKPLYYGIHNNAFLFGSELKSLRQYPGWEGTVDRNMIADFLRYSYVPSPNCIYTGMQKLPPAHYVVVSHSGTMVSPPICYWDLSAKAALGQQNPFGGSDLSALNDLDQLLTEAVGIRMASDVPLGAFLSGGYDSSTIVALMQKQSTKPVRTFSIGFAEESHNEAEHAAKVAAHIGTDHTELYVSSRDALETIPLLPRVWDEPFADSSQIPTLLVSKLARQHVTVSLSGDGGDELFCGYNRYAQGYNAWRRLSKLPKAVRLPVASALRMAPAGLSDQLFALLPSKLRVSHPSDRLAKLAEVLGTTNGDEFYRVLVSHFQNPSSFVLNSNLSVDLMMLPDISNDLREKMMQADMRTYLPDDILVKVDRASMAVGLESRVPLLDHRVVEFALALPMKFKIRDNESKWLLRQLLYRYVPKQMMERPKMGFGVPIEHWLKGPLKHWAADLLSPESITRAGFLNAAAVGELWIEYLNGNKRTHYQLWNILMFQSWLETHNDT